MLPRPPKPYLSATNGISAAAAADQTPSQSVPRSSRTKVASNMVWGLFPVDPIPGEDKYYIFSKGTYKVGRRGCDIIISKDKGVSRIHAEILVDEMSFLHDPPKKSNVSSRVRIRDCSKYGTFINKNTSSLEKVHEFPNKETLLKDGDLVSFGTGNATYKFSFVNLVFLVNSIKPLNQLQLKTSLIGALVTQNWSPECTHVLVDDLIPLKEDLLDAVLAKKPFASLDWLEFIAGKTICTELPSCISYAPTLTLEGTSTKIVDPLSREHCLRGYTFLLESSQKYKFKDRLKSLLEVGGANVIPQEMYCLNSQGMGEEDNNRVVRVIPADFTRRFECPRNLSSLPTVTEVELISALLSGHMDPCVISTPPMLVTSSCSTDETVVADSETEEEAATSAPPSAIVDLIRSAEDDSEVMVLNQSVECAEKDGRSETDILSMKPTECPREEETVFNKEEPIADESKKEVATNIAAGNWSGGGPITISKDKHDFKAERTAKMEEPESANVDVLYSQDLIVRDINLPASVQTSTDDSVINFKRFRKKGVPSGNSFNNLIPFSKHPYNESGYNNEDVAESIKAEKKRKQMENMAEDLFNHEKGKRRGVAGQLRGLLAKS